MKNVRGALEKGASDALFQEFSSAAARAYAHPYLVSNSALSKINQHSLFLEYSQGKSAPVASNLSVARNIFGMNTCIISMTST